MRNGIVNFFNLIHIVMVYIAKALMVAMVVIIFVNVVLRYVFDSGIVWSEEVALLLAVWFIFIAMSLGVKQGLHINLTVIPDKVLPKGAAKFFQIIENLVVVVIGVVMLVDGYRLVGITMRSIMPATRLPAGLLYAVLPVSAVILIYESMADLFGIDTKDRTVDSFLEGNGSLREVLEDTHA